MTTGAFRGGITFNRGDGGGPEVFTLVDQAITLSGLGKTNSLIETTNFDSGNTREYIAGLADGQEITAEFNYLPANTQQQGLRSDVDGGLTRNLQLIITDGTNTETFDFASVALSWVINPVNDDKHTVSFTFKISGNITVS